MLKRQKVSSTKRWRYGIPDREHTSFSVPENHYDTVYSIFCSIVRTKFQNRVISFLVIRDGWGIVQTVAETEAELAPLHESKAGVESIVAVEGRVVSEAQAPLATLLYLPFNLTRSSKLPAKEYDQETRSH